MDHTELIKQLRQAMFNSAYAALTNTAHQLHDLGVTPQESLRIFGNILANMLAEVKPVTDDEAAKVWEAAKQRIAGKGFDS